MQWSAATHTPITTGEGGIYGHSTKSTKVIQVHRRIPSVITTPCDDEYNDVHKRGFTLVSVPIFFVFDLKRFVTTENNWFPKRKRLRYDVSAAATAEIQQLRFSHRNVTTRFVRNAPNGYMV